MRSNSSGLEASSVGYRYGNTLALGIISLQVPRGNMLALAGPNGSGKTTLLGLLAGAKIPDRGHIFLDGSPLAILGRRGIARRIAAVAQHVDPHLMFTVQSLVNMGRMPYIGVLGGLSAKDRDAVHTAMQATDVDSLADRRFGELSGGEQQRVMIAMALAQEADYLLLDEPTLHLDLQHQHELLELLSKLNRDRSVTIVAAMHDLNLAALYFEHMALLQFGKLVAYGTTSEVMTNSRHLKVFNAPLRLVKHPQTGDPQVLLERTGRRESTHNDSHQLQQ